MSITKSILGVKKEFADNEALISYVKANLDTIIDAKKVEQYSYNKGQAVSCKTLNGSKFTVAEKAIEVDEAYWYLVVNSTNILDSHDDLHINGIWNTTVKDQQGKNYLVDTHSITIDTTIVKKEHIEMFVAKVTFASLGMAYSGSTQVLVYKFRKDKVIDQKAKEWLESGDAIQASVRMQYVSLKFALDSNAPEDKEVKKNYDDYIGSIANKDDFEYIPYFFVITEAKKRKRK